MSLGRWLQDQLFERRIVLLTGRLDDDAAAKAAAALLTLDGVVNPNTPPARSLGARPLAEGPG